MNYLKYTYKRIKELGYFEQNYNIILTHGKREHRRIIENFICCADNQKLFIKGFLNLRDKLKQDKTLTKSLVLCFRDIIFDNTCCTRFILDLDTIKYIAVLLISLFIDDKNNFKLGNVKSDFYVFKAVRILTNENYDTARTIREVNSLLHNNLPIAKEETFVDNITNFLFPYTVNLLEPTICRNRLSDEMYDSSIQKLIRTAKDEVDIVQKELRTLHVKSNVLPLLLFTNISARSLEEVDEFIMKSNLTVYQRTGFLKPEYALGEFKVEDSPMFKKRTVRSFPIQYYVNEIIHREGVVIKFQIFARDYLIFAIDDYINNKQVLYIMFYDSSQDNSDFNIQQTAFMFYAAVRDDYARKINQEKYTMPSIDLDEAEEEFDDDDNKYGKKLIRIAPYIRFLPKGAKRGEGKVEEAARFNMVLQDDETFVNSFDRHCRVLKENLDRDVEDIRFEVKYFDSEVANVRRDT